eukprot:3192157-Pleurochrysis_carterae.AAC.1
MTSEYETAMRPYQRFSAATGAPADPAALVAEPCAAAQSAHPHSHTIYEGENTLAIAHWNLCNAQASHAYCESESKYNRQARLRLRTVQIALR